MHSEFWHQGCPHKQKRCLNSSGESYLRCLTFEIISWKALFSNPIRLNWFSSWTKVIRQIQCYCYVLYLLLINDKIKSFITRRCIIIFTVDLGYSCFIVLTNKYALDRFVTSWLKFFKKTTSNFPLNKLPSIKWL